MKLWVVCGCVLLAVLANAKFAEFARVVIRATDHSSDEMKEHLWGAAFFCHTIEKYETCAAIFANPTLTDTDKVVAILTAYLNEAERQRDYRQ